MTQRPLLAAYGGLPLHFEANQGQADPQVQFLARGNGYSLFLTPNETVLALRRPSVDTPASAGRSSAATLRMKLVGANPEPTVEAVGELPGKANYFLGKDPARWRRDIPLYSRIAYRDVYPGIDVVYYGNQRNLEHDFVVSPGADPGRIRMRFEGADAVRVSHEGDLVLETTAGIVTQRVPLVYQKVDGVRKPVPGRYMAADDGEVAFDLGSYETSLPLVVDPVLEYSTFLGGTGDEGGFAIAVDASGNAYVTGETTSIDFPGNPYRHGGGGGADVFVAKLNPSGSSLFFSTYLGGAGVDAGTAVAVDASGNVYVAGNTTSLDLPANGNQKQYGGSKDAFVAKLTPSGSALSFLTYVGGAGVDSCTGVAVDSGGSAYVVGATTSAGLAVGAYQPQNAGAKDAFIGKLNSSGSALVYLTYLGGSADDEASGIAVDGNGYAYVIGATSSPVFPTRLPYRSYSGNGDAFVTKLNASGSDLVYSTCLGGSGGDWGGGIALDAQGNVYVAGDTTSSDFPLAGSPPFQSTYGGGTGDIFVTKINTTGSALVYSTYLGGNAGDWNAVIAVDPSSGSAFVAGITESTNLPVLSAPQDHIGGHSDAFVARLNSAGSDRLYLTYLGGGDKDYLYGIASKGTDAWVTGSTNLDTFLNFPTAGNPFQRYPAGGFEEAYVARLSETPSTDLPDLVVSLLQLPPTPVAPGQPVTIDYRVTNQGTFPAQRMSTLRFWLSGDATVSPGTDVQLGSDEQIASLTSGEAVRATVTRAIPAGTDAGTWYLIAVADVDDVISEGPAGEANNTRAQSFTVARLPVVAISQPTAANVAGKSKIQGHVTLTGATLVSMAYYVDTGVTPSTTPVWSGATNDYVYSWDVSGLPVDTTPTVRIVATDSLGQIGQVAKQVRVKPLVSGRARVVDEADPSQTWDLGGGIVEAAGLSMAVQAGGLFDSRHLAAGSPNEAQAINVSFLASYRYEDHISVDNTRLPFGGGCASPPGQKKERRVVTASGGTLVQGSPLSVHVDLRLPVILMHGIRACWLSTWDESGWSDRLLQQGHVVFTPNHHFAIVSKETEADEVHNQVTDDMSEIVGLGGNWPRFAVIAHSEGGVATRAWLARHAYPRSKTKRVYTLGTPHSGTEFPGAGAYGLARDTMHRFNRVYGGFDPSIDVFAIGGTGMFGVSDGVVGPQVSVFNIGLWDDEGALANAAFAGLWPLRTFAREPKSQHEKPLLHTELVAAAVDQILASIIIPHLGGQPQSDMAPAFARLGDTTPLGGGEPALSGQQRVPLAAGSTADVSFTIGTTDSVLITCLPIDLQTSITLLRPSGQWITPSDTSPDVRYSSDHMGQRFAILSPEAGEWVLRVAAGATGGTAYVGASEGSVFGLLGDTDRETYAPSSVAVIRARLVGPTTGAAVATVSATVIDADGQVQETVALFDDGSHGDGSAGDGVFANLYTVPPDGGGYDLHYEAVGTSGGHPFRRGFAWNLDVRSPVFSGGFSDVAADTNGDAIADAIVETVGLNLPKAGEYLLSGDLWDANGYPVSHATLSVAASAGGSQQQQLTFDVSEAGCSAFAGPFTVKSLRASLPAEGYRLVDTWDAPIATGGYAGAVFGCADNPEPGPSLVSVLPERAIPGDTLDLLIAGSGFAAGVAVGVGPYTQGFTVTRQSPSLVWLRWTVPASAALGALDVIVTNPDGRSSTLAGGLTLVADAAPSVSLLYPTAGQNLSGSVTVSATATDDRGITRVDFALGGTVVGSAAGFPYQYLWDTTLTPQGSHVLSATAYDTAGHSATAQVTVQVPPRTCTSFTIAPPSVSPTYLAGSTTVTINGVPAGCTGGSWQASGNGSWIAVSTESGSGPGSVVVSWSQNPGTTPRTGNASIAGVVFPVNQGAAPGGGQSQWIYYFANGAQEIRRAALDGTGDQLVRTPPSGFTNFAHGLAVSASGQTIATGVGPAAEEVELYALSITGSGAAKLANTPWLGSLTWLPGDTHVAYSRDGAPKPSAYYRIPPTGGAESLWISTDPFFFTFYKDNFRSPIRWSADGTVFAAEVGESSAGGNTVFVGEIDIDTGTVSNIRMLSPEGQWDWVRVTTGVDISPDGATVYYGWRDNDIPRWEIHRASFDGTFDEVIYQVAEENGMSGLRLSPDATRLYFSRVQPNAQGLYEIASIAVDGSDYRVSLALPAPTTFTIGTAVQTTCTSFAISPTSANPSFQAGSQAVTITGSPAGCTGGSWSASGNGSWITVSPSSGSGPGSAIVYWTQNGSNQRSGSATIAGRSFAVTQTAAPPTCTGFSISPTSASPGFQAGSQVVTITGSPSGCAGGNWTAASNSSWITVSPSGGTGPGSTTVFWSQNPEGQRVGYATITSTTFTITQGAAPPPACTSFSISPQAFAIDYQAAAVVVTITGAPTGCSGGSWSASGNGSWITVSPASGSGPGSATVFVAANTGAERASGANIAGTVFPVTQGAAPTDHALINGVPYPDTISGAQQQASWKYYSIVVPAGATGLEVTLDQLSADADLYVRPLVKPTLSLWDCRPYASGTNSEQCSTADPTPGTWWIGVSNWDTGTIQFRITATFTTSVACSSYSIWPQSLTTDHWAASTVVTVTGSPVGCNGGSWSASGNGSWITVSPASGSGSGSVGVSVTENTGGARSGSATIAGQPFSVTQGAAPPPTCTSYSLTPNPLNATASAGSAQVTLTGSPAGCAGGDWTAVTHDSWLSLDPSGGAGPGTVTVFWQANPVAQRIGTATIAGNTLTVTQAPVPGGGTGLIGYYANTRTLAPMSLSRLDPVVDFAWGNGGPGAGIGPDQWSARWLGEVEAQYTETYTLWVHGDDGFKLYVDEQLLIDRWLDQTSEWSASVNLVAGRRYRIRLEYYDGYGPAYLRLSWSSASTPKAVIPQSRLYPPRMTRQDLLWHHQLTGDLYVWQLAGVTTTSGHYTAPFRFADTLWQIRGLADFNRDGETDILWHHQGTGDLYVWYMHGAAAYAGSYLTPRSFADTRWQIRGVADFNADGQPDLLWHHQVTGDLYIWYMAATVVSGGSYLTPRSFADTRWQIRGVADFNGDGQVDLLWHHQGSGDLYVWGMTGTVVSWGSYLTPPRFADTLWKIVRVADFDADGRQDLLWHHQGTGDLYVWFLNGAVTTSGSYLNPPRFSDTNWKVVPR